MKIIAEEINKALKNKPLVESLMKREKDIIERYYGIGGKVRHTLAELGELYQLTRERIRQIKALGLRKLKIKLK